MSSTAPKLAVLALAGSALAVPYAGGHHGHRQHEHLHHNKHFFGSSGVATGTGSPYGLANATGIWGTGTAAGTAAASTGLAYGLNSGYVPAPVGPETASSESCSTSEVRVTYTNRVTVTIHASESASSAVQSYGAAPANVDFQQKAHHHWDRTSTVSSAEATTPVETSSSSSVYIAPVETSSSSSAVYVAPVQTSSSSISTYVAVVQTSAAPVASSSTKASSVASSSAAATSSVAQAGVGKRGLAYNDASLTTCFSNHDQITWGYNWGQVGTGLASHLNFVPLLWGPASSFTDNWNTAATDAISNGATHLMSFNEPDLSSQANMSPEDAAAAYKTYMMPFAGKAKLGAPAVTNGADGMGLDWLSAFLSACDGCQIDFVSIHWYQSASMVDYFKEHVANATEVAGGKPVWVTEFGCTGSSDSEVSDFLQEVMPWMDSQDYVERYSYFMVSNGMLVSGTEPSTYGSTYATYTS